MSTATASASRSPGARKGAIVGGGHYTLLFMVFAFESGWARACLLVLVGAISLFAWVGALNRARIAGDTPTSKIRSAAQGYVELLGIAAPFGAEPLRDPVTHEACVWFRVETYQRTSGRNKMWVPLKSAESGRPLLLQDDTGACEVHPEGAELTTTSSATVPDGPDLKHHVQRIRAGEKLYVAGHLQTVNDPQAAGGERHRVLAPPDGRPFLISTREDAHSGKPYRNLAMVHLSFFFVGLAALGWLAAN